MKSAHSLLSLAPAFDISTRSLLEAQVLKPALVRGETSALSALSIHVAVEDGFCCAGCLAMGRLAPVPCPVAVAAHGGASGASCRSKGGGS